MVYGKGMWQYITETDADGFIVGILPYSIKRKLFFKLITMSPETSYGGPFIIKSKERKTNSQISFENNILESLVSESFVGFIGVIPEIFILICIVLEVLYEILMKWFQKKAIESNKLARFFGWKKGKNDLSKVSRLQSLN